MSSPSLIAVRDDSSMSSSSSPGPRSGGPTSRRTFTPAQKLDHLAAYESTLENAGGAAFDVCLDKGFTREALDEAIDPPAAKGNAMTRNQQSAGILAHRVRDGERDTVDCGPGSDTVIADVRDRLVHCEHVTRR